MKSYSLFSVAALALAAASAPLSSRQTTCETGFYIIGARASEEQPVRISLAPITSTPS